MVWPHNIFVVEYFHILSYFPSFQFIWISIEYNYPVKFPGNKNRYSLSGSGQLFQRKDAFGLSYYEQRGPIIHSHLDLTTSVRIKVIKSTSSMPLFPFTILWHAAAVHRSCATTEPACITATWDVPSPQHKILGFVTIQNCWISLISQF